MKSRKVFVLVLVVALAAVVSGDERMDMRRNAVVEAVARTADAVVNISTEKVVQRRYFGDSGAFADPFFDSFMRQFTRPEIAHSLGSGGIFTPDGYIFTNAHVLDRASKVMVTLSDGSQYPAELISVDIGTDLAVLKIDAGKPLPTLRFGRSDDLMVGEKAIAVGNPFGLSNTVTTGVISATHRDVVVEGRVLFKDFLQTDALINPGNSGGPLLNIFGEVIGINTAMRADAQGIGFAIPADRAKASVAGLMDYRKLRRLRVGFDLEEEYAGVGAETRLLVKGVEEGGPALAAGVKPGDVVTAVGARPVSTLIDFLAAVLSSKGTFDVTVEREGRRVKAAIAPVEIPKPDALKLADVMLGLSVQQMERSLARDVGIDIDKGILVAGVRKGSTGGKSGIVAGDVILQVNNALTATMDEFAAALEAGRGRDSVYLVILRRQGIAYYQFTVDVPVEGSEKS